MSDYPGAVATQQQQQAQLANQQDQGPPAPPVEGHHEQKHQHALPSPRARASPSGHAVEMQPLQVQSPTGGESLQPPPLYAENAPSYVSPQQPQPYGSPPVYGQQPQYVIQPLQLQYVLQDGELIAIQPAQTVLVVGGCPAVGVHSVVEDFTPLGICLAICFFPIGVM
jgi:hypothetical protein